MKYKLTNNTLEHFGKKLYRIECVESFGSIKAGDKGGYVESGTNLSQHGNAWVCGDAWVCGNAKVYGDAEVCGNAKVYGNAEVCGNAKVYGDAEVYGDAWVYGDAEVCGNAKVYGNAEVYGDAEVCGNAKVYGNADYIVFKNNFSSGRYFTYTLSNKMWAVGCFYGTSEELIKKAYADSQEKGDHYKLYVELVEKLEALSK